MYNLHFLFEYAGERVLQPIFRKLHPGADLPNGCKKLKITVEYDFSSFCTNLCTTLVRDDRMCQDGLMMF